MGQMRKPMVTVGSRLPELGTKDSKNNGTLYMFITKHFSQHLIDFRLQVDSTVSYLLGRTSFSSGHVWVSVIYTEVSPFTPSPKGCGTAVHRNKGEGSP